MDHPLSASVTGPVYLDCNASAPLEPRVREALFEALQLVGNPHSDHQHGRALGLLHTSATERLAALFGVQPTAIVPTSGATEAIHIAHAGVRDHLAATDRHHVIVSAIEHSASRQAAQRLAASLGGELTVVPCGSDGRIAVDRLVHHLRDDTGFVSLMHVNNETGAIQPVAELAQALGEHPALLHVDAVQGFGKATHDLLEPRIDLVSVSAHKIHGPVGIGALVARDRARAALRSLLPGESHLSPLRPGTPPTALLHAFMIASELAVAEEHRRRTAHLRIQAEALATFTRLGAVIHTPLQHALPNVLSMALPGIDSEVARLVLADLVTVGNGSACHGGAPSPVLRAMGIDPTLAQSTMRWSWSHLTEAIPWDEIEARLVALQAQGTEKARQA